MRTVDQIAVVIAEQMDRIERHQHIDGGPGVERTAHHVAEVDDVPNSLRTNVRQDGFEREMIAVDVGDRSKAHGVLSSRSPDPAKRNPGGLP